MLYVDGVEINSCIKCGCRNLEIVIESKSMVVPGKDVYVMCRECGFRPGITYASFDEDDLLKTKLSAIKEWTRSTDRGSAPWRKMMGETSIELEGIESSILDRLKVNDNTEPLSHDEAFSISIDIGKVVSHLRRYLDENQPTEASD